MKKYNKVIETLHYGWSWQEWDEDCYPGSEWKFWMKCCPRCWKGPLTRYKDDKWELCLDCEFAYIKDVIKRDEVYT